MTLKIYSEPGAEPITLTEAKLHLRVDHSADDDLITALIVAARQQAEHLTGRALITQTWDRVLDAFPAGAIDLGKPPVQSIATVTYVDTNGDTVTMDSADYSLDSTSDEGKGWLFPSDALDTWPSTYDAANVVTVRFVSGYGASGSSVPQAIRQYMLLEIGTMYKCRESVAAGVSLSELPGRFTEKLLDPYRLWGI